MDLKAVVAWKGNRDKNEKSPHNSAKKEKRMESNLIASIAYDHNTTPTRLRNWWWDFIFFEFFQFSQALPIILDRFFRLLQSSHPKNRLTASAQWTDALLAPVFPF